MPGRRHRHLWLDAADISGSACRAVTYIADAKETDVAPSLHYIILLREGASAHALPEHWTRVLESVKHAE